MNESEPSASSKQSATENEVNNERDKQSNDDAVAPNEVQTADILKLDIDCCEEAFEYLLLKDLVSVGKTCKRLQQMAGHCFQQNYTGRTSSDSVGITCTDSIDELEVNVAHFAPFIREILIWDGVGMKYFFDARSNFRRIKEMFVIKLKSTDVILLKGIPMENLHMHKCELSNDFHEIIDQCRKLKRLKIEYCPSECTSTWLIHKYPTLEHLTFIPSFTNSIEGIPMFLELNPNIWSFATNSKVLRKHQDKLMTTNVKLDDLAIQYFGEEDFDFNQLIDLLNRLHECGFYKKLHFHTPKIENQEQINQLERTNGLVTLFECYKRNVPVVFSGLKNLEYLDLFSSEFVADLEMLPKNLINLKRIVFVYASIDDIMPFIRRSVEINTIKISELSAGVHFNTDTNVINLLALNKEREKLPDAMRITLHVDDKLYLATKWAMKDINLGLLRLKRDEIIEWNHYFSPSSFKTDNVHIN